MGKLLVDTSFPKYFLHILWLTANIFDFSLEMQARSIIFLGLLSNISLHHRVLPYYVWGKVLFVFVFLGALQASWIYHFMFFTKFGKILAIISSNICMPLCHLSFHDCKDMYIGLLHSSLSFCSLFFNFFVCFCFVFKILF